MSFSGIFPTIWSIKFNPIGGLEISKLSQMCGSWFVFELLEFLNKMPQTWVANCSLITLYPTFEICIYILPCSALISPTVAGFVWVGFNWDAIVFPTFSSKFTANISSSNLKKFKKDECFRMLSIYGRTKHRRAMDGGHLWLSEREDNVNSFHFMR